MDSSNWMVSIVIPVYNVDRFLDAALQSVINQTYTDYELILINDGSTDNSLNIIEKFIENNSDISIKLATQENEGQASARNKGIYLATGKYIYFFDSDDLLKENAIQTMVEELEKHELDLLLFSGEAFFETKINKDAKFSFNYLKSNNYPDIKSGEEIFIELVNNKEYTSSPCLFAVKKSVLVENNLYFHEGIIHEDGLFTFKLTLLSGKSKVIRDVLFLRRVRDSSTIMSGNYEKSFTGNYTVFIESNNFYENLLIKNNRLISVIEERLSVIYGNAINQYIYINKKNKKNYIDKIKHLNCIIEKYNYFNRIDFKLFSKAPLIYTVLRKTYDSMR